MGGIAAILIFAVLIKAFLFEVHFVPSESMEPTIIGRPELGDRVLVLRSYEEVAKWKRFDLAVFRYPLSRQVRFVKRIVGLPGEDLLIRGGDLWVREAPEGDWSIARKPAALQRRLFDAHPVVRAARGPEDWTTHWSWATGSPVTIEDDELVIGPTAHAVRIVPSEPAAAHRADRWARDRRDRGDEVLRGARVGDLRFTVELHGGAEAAHLEFAERAIPEEGPARFEVLRLEILGARLVLRHGGKQVESPALAAARLTPNRWNRLALSEADDVARVHLDDELLCEHALGGRPAEQETATVGFGVERGQVRIRRACVDRDLVWVARAGARSLAEAQLFSIPAGHYLVLGDNSASSEDARGWALVGIRLRPSGRVLLGDLHGVTEASIAPRPEGAIPGWLRTNPRVLEAGEAEHGSSAAAGGGVHRFIDVQGNRWDLEPGQWDLLDLSGLATLGVPELLTWHGRPLAEGEDHRIAIERVSSRQLTGLSHGGLTFERFAAPAPFVAREDLIGRPVLSLRHRPEGERGLPTLRLLR